MAAAGAAGLLPGGGHRARVPAHEADVQRADVDAQLQGVGGDHRAHRALAQAALDGATLAGQVAAPVAAHLPAPDAHLAAGLFQVREQDLHPHAAAGEDDELGPRAQETLRQPARLLDRRAADAQLRIDHRRVVEHEVLLSPRRPVLAHLLQRDPGELGRELARIGDGGGAADELRLRPVEGGDAAQAPQHVGHVAAEDAAVLVDLVDHHVAQVLEELHPQGVMRQDALVQHVGVGDHDVAAAADGPAGGLGRVAIEGVDLDVHAEFAHHLVGLVHLVLAQRLGGEQVERPGLGVLQQRIEDRQVVAQGLARGRGRGHHHRTAGQGGLDRGRLVDVRPRDAPGLHGADQARVQRARPVGVTAGARRDHLPAGDVAQEGLVRSQAVEELGKVHGGLRAAAGAPGRKISPRGGGRAPRPRPRARPSTRTGAARPTDHPARCDGRRRVPA